MTISNAIVEPAVSKLPTFPGIVTDSVPVEADLGSGTPLVKSCGIDAFPLRIIEVRRAGIWSVVVGLDRVAARLQVGANGARVCVHDFHVVVAPLTLDQLHAVACGKIDHRVRATERGVLDDLGGQCERREPKQESRQDRNLTELLLSMHDRLFNEPSPRNTGTDSSLPETGVARR